MNKLEFPITEQAKKSIGTAMDSQDGYGFDKYGQPLDHKDTRYNWLSMFKEEIADGLKYIECEENRKKDVIGLLEKAFRASELGVGNAGFIGEALRLLKIQGTGK